MSQIFGSPSLPQPTPIKAPPTREDPAIEDARRRELELNRKTIGRRATIVTGGQGDTSAAPVVQKRLFGG